MTRRLGLLLKFLTVLLCSLAEGYQEAKHQRVCGCQAFWQDCEQVVWQYVDSVPVGWSGGQNESLDGVENSSLWFFPTQPSEQYPCVHSYPADGEPRVEHFSVSVVNKTCSAMKPLPIYFFEGVHSFLQCDKNIYPGQVLNVTWMKDCTPLSWATEHILRFNNKVKESDKGSYTCFTTFIHNGSVYTAAKSFTVFTQPPSPVIQKPRVVKPQRKTLRVTVGPSYELPCKGFVGTDQNDIGSMVYWLVNGTFPEHPQIDETDMLCDMEYNEVHCQKTLRIKEVQEQFLATNFTCVVLNSAGSDMITLTLILGYQDAKHQRVCACQAFWQDCEQVVWQFVDSVPVGWSGGQNESLDGVENSSLRFFPTQPSEQYPCVHSYPGVGEPRMEHFSMSVVSKTCSAMEPLQIVFFEGMYGFLECDKKIYPDRVLNVTWMKDCTPLSWATEHILRLENNVKESDKGSYTCFMTFIHKGSVYTAAKRFTVSIHPPGPVIQKPRVVKPQQKTLTVTLGPSYELPCKGFVGTDQNDIGSTAYWLVNGTFPKHPQIDETDMLCDMEYNGAHCQKTLRIKEVQEQFLATNFTCVVLNSAGFDTITLTLILDSGRALYYGVILLIAYVMVLLVVVLLHIYKVELVLFYRSLRATQHKDGKLYDAYVSYLYDNDPSESPATTFALRVLPAVLEDRFGYRLFIRGRDETPGAAVHDVVSETVGRSRRLIIVLRPSDFTSKSTNSATTGLLRTQSNVGPYECWLGLYEALIKESLQVIVVQVDGELDVALLPESLRYVVHTRGLLRWKPNYANKPRARFWKQLRYRMPAAQRLSTGLLV